MSVPETDFYVLHLLDALEEHLFGHLKLGRKIQLVILPASLLLCCPQLTGALWKAMAPLYSLSQYLLLTLQVWG